MRVIKYSNYIPAYYYYYIVRPKLHHENRRFRNSETNNRHLASNSDWNARIHGTRAGRKQRRRAGGRIRTRSGHLRIRGAILGAILRPIRREIPTTKHKEPSRLLSNIKSEASSQSEPPKPLTEHQQAHRTLLLDHSIQTAVGEGSIGDSDVPAARITDREGVQARPQLRRAAGKAAVVIQHAVQLAHAGSAIRLVLSSGKHENMDPVLARSCKQHRVVFPAICNHQFANHYFHQQQKLLHQFLRAHLPGKSLFLVSRTFSRHFSAFLSFLHSLFAHSELIEAFLDGGGAGKAEKEPVQRRSHGRTGHKRDGGRKREPIHQTDWKLEQRAASTEECGAQRDKSRPKRHYRRDLLLLRPAEGQSSAQTRGTVPSLPPLPPGRSHLR